MVLVPQQPQKETKKKQRRKHQCSGKVGEKEVSQIKVVVYSQNQTAN
jgi:hypothetical protein